LPLRATASATAAVAAAAAATAAASAAAAGDELAQVEVVGVVVDGVMGKPLVDFVNRPVNMR